MSCRGLIAQIPNLSVFTRLTIPFATVMLHASYEHSTVRAASLALTNGFLIRGPLLVVRETRLAPNMSITFVAGNYDGGEDARSSSHSITTCLVTAMCCVSSACFVT